MLRGEANTYGLPQGTRIRAELRQFFAEQRRAISAWLATGTIPAKGLTRRELKAIVLEAKDDPPIPAGFPDLADFGLGDDELASRMTPLLQLIWADAIEGFAPRVGIDPKNWSVTNPRIGEAIDAASLALSESTNATTSLALDDALAKVRESLLAAHTGETLSYDDLTKAINAIFDTASQSRARTIAVTESARAVHAAQELLAIQSEVVTGWKWLLSSDACPMCQTIARRCPVVRLGQDFAVIGDNPSYSHIRFPPAHPRCQCSMVEVLDIDEQPTWSETLIQPVPEDQDYPPDA